ncbi:MAG TPA: tRNA-uridine aminocarboxypropyltransferase [Kofleriaceae bacterium]|nr:tRNA-uridine aminocarboxypropyltransferase [Kofleriaceae bacterium]
MEPGEPLSAAAAPPRARAAPPPNLGRPRCDRCRRPLTVCYCAALPRLETATRVVILQHPRERDVAIGTARMASLALPSAELHVGVRWGEHPRLARALSDPARPPILLYPGPDATDILAAPPPGPVTLVVVDGTWSQARTVVRDNPVLRALPRYAFRAPEPSEYRIRPEPSDEYVSTIEALMHVLGALEGDPARFRALLDPFRAMVDAQLACQAASPRRRRRAPRPPGPPRRPLPDDVLAAPDSLVCVVAEANAWPYAASPAHAQAAPAGAPAARRRGAGRSDLDRDELVHWVAHRVTTGETFDVVAAPEGPLSPSTPYHIGLAAERLRAGAPRAELLAAFARFLRPGDRVCAWGHYGPRLFLDAGGALPAPPIDVRAAAQRFTSKKFGSLEDYAATLGPAPAPVADGRAGRRAALLAQIVRAWLAPPGGSS